MLSKEPDPVDKRKFLYYPNEIYMLQHCVYTTEGNTKNVSINRGTESKGRSIYTVSEHISPNRALLIFKHISDNSLDKVVPHIMWKEELLKSGATPEQAEEAIATLNKGCKVIEIKSGHYKLA